MNELWNVLMSWAVTLSGYPMPDKLPQVVPVPHAYFVQHACGGHECKVWGWYARGDALYIDARLDPSASLLASSIVVHEMTHYLQERSGRFSSHSKGAAFGAAPDCTSALAMEMQAYGVQREYLLRYGVYQPVGISMHSVGCEKEVVAPPGH